MNIYMCRLCCVFSPWSSWPGRIFPTVLAVNITANGIAHTSLDLWSGLGATNLNYVDLRVNVQTPTTFTSTEFTMGIYGSMVQPLHIQDVFSSLLPPPSIPLLAGRVHIQQPPIFNCPVHLTEPPVCLKLQLAFRPINFKRNKNLFCSIFLSRFLKGFLCQASVEISTRRGNFLAMSQILKTKSEKLLYRIISYQDMYQDTEELEIVLMISWIWQIFFFMDVILNLMRFLCTFCGEFQIVQTAAIKINQLTTIWSHGCKKKNLPFSTN